MVAARLLARVPRQGAAAVAASAARRQLCGVAAAAAKQPFASSRCSARVPYTLNQPLRYSTTIFQRFGFSSSTPQENDKEVNQPKGESNGEASKEAGGAEDLDLSKEELVKLVLEKDELLTSKDEEIKDMKDKVLRSYAEMENVIARTKRESENSKKFAVQNFSKSLLDVADNLARASSAVKESFSKLDTSEDSSGAVPLLKTLLEGVDMTDKQLGEVFKKFGVTKFDPLNEKFDPERHYAVFQMPDSSKPSGTVAAVAKVGYMLHDRVLRPAEVGVTGLFWSEKDDSSNSEQDQEHDNETDNKAHQSIQISLRLWPAQEHAVIKIFRGGNWVLTKDYILSWMKPEDVRTEYNLQVEFGGSFADVLGFRNNDCTMDFEVRMDCTPMLKNLVTLLKPSICNFQIIKKVGGQDACKVFKCLFMGKRCALKSLAQKNPCTLEPREVEIISNVKDTHVMIFYQAWTEPWRNKGKAEQEYLFIHLEFCQSTLKHALLYENRHWFTQKWLLFEEIVRIVHKLHKACVVHRDLKPDNIFFNSELSVRIGDFGDACVGRDEFGLYGGGTPKLGTQYYFAEELNSGGKVTEKVDVYSLGVILFEIFAMFQTGLERNSVFHNLREQGPPDNWDGDRELYDMMTALKPSDRPSTSQILDYIRIHHLE